MRIASLLLTLTLASTAAAGELLIPTTYRGGGANGSEWRTEIAISNVSTSTTVPVPIAVTLYRGQEVPLSLHVPLAQMEALTVKDALREWFGVEDGGGIVSVTWTDPNARIGANARIYNISSSGEFGQGVPSVRVDRLVSDVFLPGLTGVNGNRTNVGISNPHDRYVLFWVVLYDRNGAIKGDFATYVEPKSYRQFNDIFAYFPAGPLDGATIRVSSSDASIYAYASVVRNDTGDATFIGPVE